MTKKIKLLILLAVFLLSVFAIASQPLWAEETVPDISKEEALTPPISNAKIIRLHQLGEKDTFIIARIEQAQRVSFSLDADAIAFMKKNGVSHAVTTAMFRYMGMYDGTPETMTTILLPQLEQKEQATKEEPPSPGRKAISYSGFRAGYMKFSDSRLGEDFGKGGIYGIETTRWFESIGVGITIDYFERTAEKFGAKSKVHIFVLPVAVSVLYRFGATGLTEPSGFPYVGLGAGAYFAKDVGTSSDGQRAEFKEQGPGIRAVVGAQWNISKSVALFSELNWFKTYIKIDGNQDKTDVGGPNITAGVRF